MHGYAVDVLTCMLSAMFQFDVETAKAQMRQFQMSAELCRTTRSSLNCAHANKPAAPAARLLCIDCPPPGAGGRAAGGRMRGVVIRGGCYVPGSPRHPRHPRCRCCLRRAREYARYVTEIATQRHSNCDAMGLAICTDTALIHMIRKTIHIQLSFFRREE